MWLEKVYRERSTQMVLDCLNKPKQTAERSICRHAEMACDRLAREPHAQLVPLLYQSLFSPSFL